MHKLVSALFFLFSCLNLFSQDRVDSLKRIASDQSYSQQSLDALVELVQIYFNQDLPDSMYVYVARLNTSLLDQNYKVSPSFLYQWASINDNISDFDRANDMYQKAIERSVELDDNEVYVKASNRLAYILSVRGDYDEAVEIILRCINYIDENKLESLRESAFIHAAFVYRNSKDFQRASLYFNQALSLGDSTNRNGYFHVALHELGNLALTKSDFIKALDYQKRALKLREDLGLTNYLDYSYNDIALSYSHLEDYSKAIYYYTKSIEQAKKKKEIWGVSISYLCIGDMYFRSGNVNLAKLYLDSSLVISKQYNMKENLHQINHQFYLINISQGDYRKALDHYILAQSYKDSIHGEDSQKQIRYLNAKFQSEKKDKELLKNQLTIKRQLLLIVIFISGVIIICGFAVWLLFLHRKMKLYNHRLKEKNIQIENQKNEIVGKRDELEKQANILREINNALVERNTRINQQKEEIESQRDEIESQRDLLLQQKHQLELVNQHLTDSIHYAENIQQTMLPSDWQFNLAFKEHFVFYKPLDIVSGDFYWLHREKGFVFFAVADCTGHGVSGAFMSLLGISFLNEIIRIKGFKKPNLILDELRSNIIDSLKQNLSSGSRKDGMDIALCVYETETRMMHYSGANNPCWIIRNGKEFYELQPDNNPVSIYFRMQSFTTKTFQLQENDCIYLFSDGFCDQYGGENNKKFQKRNFKEFILRNAHQPFEVQKELLKQSNQTWTGKNPQIDDITILGVKV